MALSFALSNYGSTVLTSQSVGLVLQFHHCCNIHKSGLSTYKEDMSIALSFLSRNKSSVFLLALALIVGGVGASANNHLNSPSGGYLLCVNSRTQVVTYPGTLSCPQESKELVLGAQGVAGPIGLQGVARPKGEPGRDVTGGRGPDRSIDELFLCDGLDVDLVADERCRIGFKGPAGGVIFFVDYHDQYEGFNYLEAAPKGWSLNVRVKQGGPRGETNNGGQGDARMNHCTKNDSLMNTSKFDWDVGRGESNTAALLVKCQ